MSDASKSPIYVYRSPFGTMTIRRALTEQPAWFLTYEIRTSASNGEQLVETHGLNEGWPTAEKVAELVLQQRSGWAFWDSLPPICFPASLDDWTKVDPHSSMTIGA
ncbi:MAG: hypothetical protein ACTHKE_03510 [Sphingomicrobium sp.]